MDKVFLSLLLLLPAFLEMVVQLRLARFLDVQRVYYFARLIFIVISSACSALNLGDLRWHSHFVPSAHHVHENRHFVLAWCSWLCSEVFILQLVSICLVSCDHGCWVAETAEFLFFISDWRLPQFLWNCCFIKILVDVFGLLNLRIVILDVVLVIQTLTSVKLMSHLFLLLQGLLQQHIVVWCTISSKTSNCPIFADGYEVTKLFYLAIHVYF